MSASASHQEQGSLRPMAKGTEKTVQQHAHRAADKRKKPADPLTWSEALADAPWEKEGLLLPWEDTYRRAYAMRLVERGLASEAAPTGRTSGPSGESTLARRTLRCSEEEFAEHDRRAAAAGIPWSTWVRRKLAEP